ncbi:MAG: hypothetical protein WCI73_01495 [Phycisphaerae bacterium]
MKKAWRQMAAGGLMALSTGAVAWAQDLAVPTTAARFVSTAPAPATMPAAVTTSAPATQPRLDLTTPQAALKSMLLAQAMGDLAAVRKCLVFPTPRDRETWEYEAAPWVARVGLAQAAVARFQPVGGDDVILLHEVQEATTGQIKGIAGLKLVVRGTHATLRRDVAATTQAATSTATRAADDADDAAILAALDLQQDAAGQWRVVAGAGDLASKVEPEEFAALKKAVPAKLELYARLQKEIEDSAGPLADFAAYQAKLDAGEALIMEQILNDPDKPATLPATLPATRPALAEPPPLDLHATADTKPATKPVSTEPATQANHQDTKAPSVDGGGK